MVATATRNKFNICLLNLYARGDGATFRSHACRCQLVPKNPINTRLSKKLNKYNQNQIKRTNTTCESMNKYLMNHQLNSRFCLKRMDLNP
jgi:hypothetical protein